MQEITHRLSHQDRQVETPHIESQILHALHLIYPLRQELSAQQSQEQRHHQDGGYIPENHRAHIKKGHICPLLYHREKTRDDDHRKDIRYHRIGSQRTNASAQLFRYHRHGSCRRTDKADEGTLKNQFDTIILSKLEDQHHHHQSKGSSYQLQDKMPGLRSHLLDLNLAEGNIEQRKEYYRHQIYQFRSHSIPQRFQKRNIGKNQIAHGSQYQRAGQREFPKE